MTPHHWIKWRLRVRYDLLDSGTNPYAEHGRLVPDVVPFNHGKTKNLPHVKFATPAYLIRRCERPIYGWTNAVFSEPSEECSLVCWSSYHLPFRLQRNTRKRSSIKQCLVNSRKYTSRRNPSIGKTPLVFFNSTTSIAIANTIQKMHVKLFHVGKPKGMLGTCLRTIHNAAVTCIAFILKEVHVQFNGKGELTCSNMPPHSRTEMDSIVSWQVQCMDAQEDHTGLWSLSP